MDLELELDDHLYEDNHSKEYFLHLVKVVQALIVAFYFVLQTFFEDDYLQELAIFYSFSVSTFWYEQVQEHDYFRDLLHATILVLLRYERVRSHKYFQTS